MRMGRTCLGLVGVVVAFACGCDDGGSDGAGASGTTSGTASTASGAAAFGLNDVILEGTQLVAGTTLGAASAYIGYHDCPQGLDCDATTIVLDNGTSTVDLGQIKDFFQWSPQKLEEIAAGLTPGADVYLDWTLPNGDAGTFGPIRCPKDFQFTAPDPATVVASPTALPVTWTAFGDVATDDSALAETHSVISAIEWDDDLNLNNGLRISEQIPHDAVSFTLDVPAKFDISDRLVVEVSAAGALYRDAGGFEGSCNIGRRIALALQ